MSRVWRSAFSSTYRRARGYSVNCERVFCNKDGEVTRVPIVEHVPPDVTACIFWLKNRDPARWRDTWRIEGAVGRYVVSDKTLSEAEWIKLRNADVLDGEATEVMLG
jgi:hypothetical protein